jgi:hypothetical protein
MVSRVEPADRAATETVVLAPSSVARNPIAPGRTARLAWSKTERVLMVSAVRFVATNPTVTWTRRRSGWTR